MKHLEALHRRGYSVREEDGKLVIRPRPSPGLVDMIRNVKEDVLAELEAHRQECIRMVEEIEQQVLDSKIPVDEAVQLLVHAFTITASAPTAHPACDCGENLLWSYPDDTATTAKLPPLCSRCYPPPSRRSIVWWLAE